MNKKRIKQNGGENIIEASVNVAKSMISLGNSIFNEIKEITDIKKELSNGVVTEPGTPNVMNGPPQFNAPKL